MDSGHHRITHASSRAKHMLGRIGELANPTPCKFNFFDLDMVRVEKTGAHPIFKVDAVNLNKIFVSPNLSGCDDHNARGRAVIVCFADEIFRCSFERASQLDNFTSLACFSGDQSTDRGLRNSKIPRQGRLARSTLLNELIKACANYFSHSRYLSKIE